jgi:hypothetical protein
MYVVCFQVISSILDNLNVLYASKKQNMLIEKKRETKHEAVS